MKEKVRKGDGEDGGEKDEEGGREGSSTLV